MNLLTAQLRGCFGSRVRQKDPPNSIGAGFFTLHHPLTPAFASVESEGVLNMDDFLDDLGSRDLGILSPSDRKMEKPNVITFEPQIMEVPSQTP